VFVEQLLKKSNTVHVYIMFYMFLQGFYQRTLFHRIFPIFYHLNILNC